MTDLQDIDSSSSFDELSTVRNSPKRPIGADGLPHTGLNPVEESSDKQSVSDHSEEESSESARTMSPFGAVTSLMNGLIGAGILGIPNAFSNSGIAISLILLVLMCVLSLIAGDLVLYLAGKSNCRSFGQLAETFMGTPGALSLSILNILFLITAMTAYLILAGDSLISWFKLGGIDMEHPSWKRMLLVLVYSVALPIALTIPKNLSFISYIATVTIFCVIYFVVTMIIKSICYMVKNHGVNPTVVTCKIDMKLFSAFSIFGLSFAMPAVILPPLEHFDKNIKKRMKVACIAILLTLAMVAIPGIFSYLQFGSSANGNILKSFPDNDIVVLISRIGFFLVVTVAYIVVGESAISSWSQMLFKEGTANNLPTIKRVVVLLFTNVIPLAIAMFMPSAKPALSIGGAIGGSLVDFCYPTIIYVLYNRGKKPMSHPKMVLCIAFAIFGLIAGVISTYQSVVDAIAAF